MTTTTEIKLEEIIKIFEYIQKLDEIANEKDKNIYTFEGRLCKQDDKVLLHDYVKYKCVHNSLIQSKEWLKEYKEGSNGYIRNTKEIDRLQNKLDKLYKKYELMNNK